MANLTTNLRGALFMMASMAGFALNDAVMKDVLAGVPLFQAVFVRGIAATLLIGALAWSQGALNHRPSAHDSRFIALRAAAEIGTTICFLTALANMPLANATAILQSTPLAITLAAAFLLREHVGWRRFLAAGVGFAGVLIIIRPGAEGFNAFAFYAVGAVVFLTMRDLATRRLSQHVPSLFVALITSAVIMALGAIGSPFVETVPLDLTRLVFLSIAALFLLIGYVFGVMAMRDGEIAFISPFRYSILLWALVLGVIFFKEVPDQWTVVGCTLIVGMGLFTFYREQRQGAR